LDKKTFENNLRSATINLRKSQAHRQTSNNWSEQYDYKRDKSLLDDWEIQLSEHFKTPYVYPLKVPYRAREITSEQLQEHLRQMETRK